MARIIINNKAVNAEVGDNLLDLAKLQPAHIGFVCGGKGLCGTCELKVLEGASALTKPTRVENDWLAPRRLQQGYRLACQTEIKSEGTIRLLTRAEEVRREFLAIFNPPKGKNPFSSAGDFLADVANPNQVAQYLGGVVSATGRVGVVKMLFPWDKPLKFLEDAGRVIQAQIITPEITTNSKPKPQIKVEVAPVATEITVEPAAVQEGAQLIEQLSTELEQKFVELATPLEKPVEAEMLIEEPKSEGEAAFSEIQAEVATKLEGIYAEAEAEKKQEEQKKQNRFKLPGFRRK
jgi:ferredoxin